MEKMRKHPAIGDHGFTLVEVIVSLILIGVMSIIAGMGLVAITKGYFFSQQNNETSMKAQVAMARMVKEIGYQDIKTYTVTAATENSISYTYTDPVTSATASHTIALSGAEIQFDGVALVDKINSFALSYFDAAGNPTAVLANIRRVDIDLRITGADDIVSTFKNSVTIQESYY
ncbi:MAG: prepilin-type N-terminal cleavage/methylation domain-containing protein [Deltaproteobacteria bacterium]